MALADIINRIASDASDESERELSAARARAKRLLDSARSEAEAEHEHAIETARRQSALEAATLVASARLEARDGALTAKREILKAALEGVVAGLEGLPSERYVAFLAAGISKAARSGDSVSLGSADAGHLAGVKAAVTASVPELSLSWDESPAPITRGAIVSGSRTTLEISPAAVVHERGSELELMLAEELFAGEER